MTEIIRYQLKNDQQPLPRLIVDIYMSQQL
jgi:hypothetical protein